MREIWCKWLTVKPLSRLFAQLAKHPFNVFVGEWLHDSPGGHSWSRQRTSFIVYFFSLLLFVLYILSASSRIPTHSSAPPWSLTHCYGPLSLLCLIKSKAGWGALVAVSLHCTFPLSCFPSTRLWGISAPSDPWWRGTQWPDMEANSWISKLLSGEVRILPVFATTATIITISTTTPSTNTTILILVIELNKIWQ